MQLISILALAVAHGQGPASGPTVTLGDRTIALKWSTPQLGQVSADLSSWKGWGYSKGATADWKAIYPLGLVAPSIPDAQPVATFKLKVILLAQRFGDTGDNPTRLQRLSMPDYAIEEQLQAIARDTEYLRAALKGLIQIDADIEVRKTTIFGTVDGPNPTDDPWVQARLNGYGYEADDKVRRGPFHWVEVRVPGREYPSLVPGVIAHLNDLAHERGYKLGQNDSVTPESIKDVLSLKPATSVGFKANHSLVWGLSPNTVPSAWVSAVHSDSVVLSLSEDPERGKVLRYVEQGYYRHGGFSLPKVGADFSGHKKLTFWMKSDSKDALTANLTNATGVTAVGVGGDLGDAIVPYRYDGTWQKVTLPLSASGHPVTAISLGAPVSPEKHQLRNPMYVFDDFEFEDDDQPVAYETLKPDFDSPYGSQRLAALVQYGKSPTAELRDKALKMLDDRDDEVRLAAVKLFAKEPGAESKLIENVFHIDGFVCRAAIEALAARQSELGWAQIRTALAPGTPLRRISAAKALASKQDAMLSGPIAGLIGDPDPIVRKSASLVIASLPGDQPPKILSVFFDDIDPDVASTAMSACNPDDALVARSLEYKSVNDPWDSVRLAAYLRLAGSKNPDIRKEGWKGARDDSDRVRSKFLTLANGPELAAALKTGYGDSSPSVRLAVVLRLAADTEGKLAGTLDPDVFKAEFAPNVVDALIKNAAVLKLPDAVVESLKASQKDAD